MRLHVVVRLAEHGSQHRQFVRVRGGVREDLGDVDAALPVLLEAERARHQRAGMALPDDDVAFARQRLACEAVQGRLGIERIHVADAAAHEQRDDTLRARREVRLLRGMARGAVCTCRRAGCPAFSSHASPRPLMPPQDSKRKSRLDTNRRT